MWVWIEPVCGQGQPGGGGGANLGGIAYAEKSGCSSSKDRAERRVSCRQGFKQCSQPGSRYSFTVGAIRVVITGFNVERKVKGKSAPLAHDAQSRIKVVMVC